MIDANEYNEPRDSYIFARWVNEKLLEIEKSREGRSAIRRRNERMVKKLMEEALPISRYALALSIPGLTVNVQCCSGDQNYDGKVLISGYREAEHYIEVTTLWSYEESLRMEKLDFEGGCFGYGPIRRDKSTGKIISQCTAVDGDHHVGESIKNTISAIEKKLNKQYDPNTVLLVNNEVTHEFPIEDRTLVVKGVREGLIGRKMPFLGTYILFSNDMCVEFIH